MVNCASQSRAPNVFDVLAVVYSQPEEAVEIRRHIAFLQSEGYLKEKPETLDMEELPGVQGLKAFRVDVDLGSAVLAENAAIRASGENVTAYLQDG